MIKDYRSNDQKTPGDIEPFTKIASTRRVEPPRTLITGASRGIGLCFCHEFAKRGHPLLLVALPEERLEQAALAISKKYDIPVDYIGIDLTADHAPQKVLEYCQDRGYIVDILINNAGIGFAKRFDKMSMDKNLSMIKLNSQAMVGLAHYFLPMLLKQTHAHIFFMSSMEATLALPYKSVYTSTKNFTYSFALALREELKKTKVNVHVGCPGPVLTNADGLKRIEAQGRKGRLLMKTPEEVAAYTVQKMEKNTVRIVPGRLNRFLLWVARHLPISFKMSILERMFRCFKDH